MSMKERNPQYLITPSGREIAYHQSPGASPGIMFLGGFKSDMTGTKAQYLDQWARNRKQAFIRFDYSGHGQSSESFSDGSIGDWLEDAQQILLQVAQGPQIIVGSSMGGWLSLLLAKNNPKTTKGLVTIACATDFTEKLLLPALSKQQLETISQVGQIELSSNYQQSSQPITLKLLVEGRNHLLLNDPIPIQCPVRMLHGLADDDVPWNLSLETLNKIDTNQVTLELIKGGDHRLSSSSDLKRIEATLEALL